MVVVYYGGALGNKMFEYACAYVINKEYKDIDVKFFDTLKNVVWYDSPKLNDIFETSMDINEITNCDFYKITGIIAPPNILKYLPVDKRKLTNLWYKIDSVINKKSELRKEGKIIRRGFSYVEFQKFQKEVHYFLKGHFCNTKYFEKYKEDIIREFTFKNSISSPELKDIRNKNSVAVHVRRGDHVMISSIDKYAYNCNLCNEKYYIRAIQIMQEKYSDASFFFFSDDVEYVKKTYGFLGDIKVVKSEKDYVDMQLMSNCKHNIIANSTFGYWSAFLNQNENKTVIAPKYYEYRNGKPIEFLYPNNWISLEV